MGYVKRGRYLQDECEEPSEHRRTIEIHDQEERQRFEDVWHLREGYVSVCVSCGVRGVCFVCVLCVFCVCVCVCVCVVCVVCMVWCAYVMVVVVVVWSGLGTS